MVLLCRAILMRLGCREAGEPRPDRDCLMNSCYEVVRYESLSEQSLRCDGSVKLV